MPSSHDARLRQTLRPPDWVNPEPAARYNLVVLGGGPAGLIAALGAAGLGAKVALVESALLGGDCLNQGCVPSKVLLASAHAAARARSLSHLGVCATEVQVDFAAVMERARKTRADIAPHDSPERLRETGVDVFLGHGRFAGRDRVQVGEHTLRFAKALIATGAGPTRPRIPGIERALDTHSLWALEALPESLVVLGGGAVGCELAQAFGRLGARVHLLERGPRLLPDWPMSAVEVLKEQLRRDGVQIQVGARVTSLAGEGPVEVCVEGQAQVVCQRVLVATGRAPRLDFDPDKAGVQVGAQGVVVDGRLRSTNPDVYACGDVIGVGSTHGADHQARVVLQNALFPGGKDAGALVIPRVLYTEPELAWVGVGPEEAERLGLRCFSHRLEELDRGRAEGEQGLCEVYADRGGRIHGACIAAPHAGELLAPLTLAMTQGLGLSQIATTVHPYPTRSELLFRVASAWRREQLGEGTARALGWWMGLRR
ncbi:MAG: FAD-dependent oxidoreductase [Myxococcota bacterium]|nr:FAD-dependent oxidoreductase [Myxococcota bacterium]